MENYDIDTIISLFKERGNPSNFLINKSEPDKFQSILDRFPVFEKYNCFSFSMSLKQGKSVKQLLRDNQYTEKFSIDELTLILNSEITPTSAFIIFYNIFSFLFYSDDNDSKKLNSSLSNSMENEMTIEIFILFMKCLISLTHLQFQKTVKSDSTADDQNPLNTMNVEPVLPPSFYNRQIFFFFKKIFVSSLHFFNGNDKSADENQIRESVLLILAFFDTQRKLPAQFFDLFISFIFKFKIQEFYEQILNLLLKLLNEKRLLILHCDVSKIIEYINPYLLEFNQRSLDIIVAVSMTFQPLSKSVIDCFSNLSLSLINAILSSSPKIKIESEGEKIDLPYNINDQSLNLNSSNFELIKEISPNFFETESRFEKGFILPSLSTNGINWLLGKFDTNIIEIVGKLLISFMHSNEDFIDNFLNIFETAISKINQIYYFDALIIFYHFATAFQNTSFISKYFNFILDPKLFNEKETIFTSLSEEKNAFRNAAFEILSNFPETISAFIIKSLNPLFRTELLLRIQNSSSFHIIIQDVINVCLSLRTIDMKWHCEAIEKARCSSFCFLSELFLGMFNSYEYFGTIMQFCMEKTITNIFINLYKESTITLRNFELLQKVFDFIDKILNVSLEISWKLIKITDSIFEKRNYLIIQMKNFFILIMNYILKLKSESASNPSLLNKNNDVGKRSFKAVKMSLKYISLFDIINSKYLYEITKHLSNNMSEELFMELLVKMGKSPKFSNKIDFFVIKYPIFIPIILFSCGLTERMIGIFTNLCNFSIKNICYMHDQQVDSIFIQILQGKKIIEYRNEIFDNFYYDISIPTIVIKDFLFNICSYKTDYRIVSKFLMDKAFIPFVYSLLSNYQNNKLPILNIPTMTAESRVPLNSSHFLNNFSISFWFMIDINYLLTFPNENIDLITIQNGVYRFGIYVQGSKLRVYYANGTRRSDVTLLFLKTSKCMWNFIETSYICKKKMIKTFYKELPISKSEFDEVVFNDENPITIKINSSIQKRVYNPRNNSYLSFYSFKKNEFIGFIRDVSFYDRKLKVKEILDLFNRSINNDIISVASLSRTGDFNVYYQHYDNLFNVLKRGTTVIKLTKILLEPCQEENICYCILNILSLLADSIDIPFASLLIFVNDENHFKFKGVFNCFYSIFESIKTNQSSKIKFFNAFISNVPIWSNYINFRKILYFYQTKLIIRNFDLLINNSGLNLFLYYFDLIDSKYWDDYLFFLKMFLEKMVQNDGTNEHIAIAILSCINRKYNLIKESSENLINNQQNLSYIILEQLKIETSNITAFYPSIFQPESENKKDETSIFKTKKIAEIHPNKLATSSSRKEKKKLKELKMFDVVPKSKQFDILHDIPEEFKDNLMVQIASDSKQIKNITINNEIQNANDDDDDNLSDEYRMYIFYMLDLINYKSSIFLNNKDVILTLFQLLKLKDLQITKKVLISLYKISSEQSISAFTIISYNNLNKEFFKPIYECLTEKINEFPNFFPLACFLSYSIKPQPDCFEFLKKIDSLEMNMRPDINNNDNNNNNNIFNFLSNSNNNFKIEFDPWYLFPIMLSFTLSDESLLLLFKILVQNSKREQKTIERMIVLFHLMTNYYENKIILARFLEYLYNFYNEFIFEIIKYLAMILFTHPYLENNPYLTLLHLINNESIISKSIEYEIGMRFYHNKKWNNSFQILMKLLDFLPESHDESSNKIILSLNSILKSEIHSSNSFYEMSITCEQLIKDYKLIFEENFNEIFSVLRYMLQSNNDTTKIENSEHYRKIINGNNNNLEIINNQVDLMFKKRKRLSSQFDPIFRQMIYRIDDKLPKDIIVPDINCFLFNNSSEGVTNIGIHYDQKGSKVSISTPTSERYFDIYNDVNFAFKRKDDEVFEIFTKFGKKYRLQFFGKHQKREIARSNSKIFDDFVKKWTQSEITNFEFLMILNAFADNIHQDKAIFPSPLYKNKAIPDGDWSLVTINNGTNIEDKKNFVFITKRLSLMPNFRFTVNQVPKKRRISLLNAENKNTSKKSNLFSSFRNKLNQENEIEIDKNSSINIHKSDSVDNDIKKDDNDNDNKENNNENENESNEKENEIDTVSVNKEVIDICLENPVVPARYFYDFEIYTDENNDADQALDDLNSNIDNKRETKNQKNEFELLYNMRKCIENCTNIDDFANEYLSIQIRNSRKLIERKNCPGIIQNESSGNIIFAVSINSFSCSDCSSFIAINSDFYVKYFSCTKTAETMQANSFLSNLNQTETSQSKHTMLHEGSLPSFLVSNDILLSSSVQSLTLNEADSFVLNNVSNKSRLFQIDDGIAAFDPKKKILVIFTTSSIDSISTSPSPLSLTSLNPFYAKNFDSSVLVPLIFATSIPEVHVKTYTTAMSDSIDLLCGNSERQFYTVSPTVVYSNNCFFAQFNSEIKILKVSFNFNIIIAATEDGKIHIRSSTSGKKVTTINGCSGDDEIAEIVITRNFGFVAVFLKSGLFNLFTINGTLIKSLSLEKKYDINFWFTFDNVQGIDYVGFVTNNDKIFYFEAFYPKTLVEMKGNEKFKNILSVNYDKFSKCFLVLNTNGDFYVVTHNAIVVPINYNLIWLITNDIQFFVKKNVMKVKNKPKKNKKPFIF